METDSGGTGGGERAPKAAQISMEDFIESATLAVLRALEKSGLNPQPLPPKDPPAEGRPPPEADAASPLNPQPLPPFDITVGLIISSGQEIAVAPRSAKR